MKHLTTLTIVAALALVAPAHAGKNHKHTYPRSANSTAYCLTGQLADGSRPRLGVVAMNRHPLGTRITLKQKGPNGRRRFVVRDRIGWGSELDIWTPSCAWAYNVWGRRQVQYRIGWHR